MTEILERNGICTFEIGIVTLDQKLALAELERIVKEDPFGDFKSKGIAVRNKYHCESQYQDGFFQVSVVEKELS